MKKFGYLLVGLLMFGVAIKVSAASMAFSFTGSDSAVPLEEVNLTLKLTGASNETKVKAMAVELTFDETKLELLSITKHSSLGASFALTPNIGGKSFALVASADADYLVGDALVAVFKFKVKDTTASSSAVISFNTTSLTDDADAPIVPINTNSGHTININAKSTNNNLSALGVTGSVLSPDFSKDVTSYAVTVPFVNAAVTITATPEDSKSIVTGTGSKTLKVGVNTYNIIVTSESGTAKTYKLVITREEENGGPSSANLLDLSIAGVSLATEFNKNTILYTASAPSNLEKAVVSVKLENPKATYKVNGDLTLLPDKINAVEIVVTSEDKKTTKTYTVNIVKEKEVLTGLKSIKINNDNITLKKGERNYTYKVKNGIKSAEVEALAFDSDATVDISGTSGFKVGKNTVTIVVTESDGSKSTYSIEVTREALKEEGEKKKKDYTLLIVLGSLLLVLGICLVFVLRNEKKKKTNKQIAKSSIPEPDMQDLPEIPVMRKSPVILENEITTNQNDDTE